MVQSLNSPTFCKFLIFVYIRVASTEFHLSILVFLIILRSENSRQTVYLDTVFRISLGHNNELNNPKHNKFNKNVITYRDFM